MVDVRFELTTSSSSLADDVNCKVTRGGHRYPFVRLPIERVLGCYSLVLVA